MQINSYYTCIYNLYNRFRWWLGGSSIGPVRTSESSSGRQSSGGWSVPGGGDPPGGWGCSSYQRLSKFAGIWGTPILKSGLRGTAKKTPQRRVCDETPQKRVKNACILGFFGHFWGFFGHFWPFLAIFGHFWTFLTPPGVSVEGPPQTVNAVRPS